MRKDGVLTYLLSDHLGSTSIVTDASGNKVSEMRYKAAHRVLREGEVRYTSGTTPTDYGFTGQYSHQSDFGLVFYNARYYDSALGRFAQADTIVPGGVQGLDRYAYVNNSPMNFVDPSGHCVQEGDAPPGSVVNQNICQGLLTYAGDNDVTEDGKPFTRNIGGSEVYGLFLQYQNTCGWWNANCNVPFGIEEFVGMWAMLESNGNEDAAHVIATIIAQNLYNGGNNPATCSVGLCYSGVFNFMAQYSQGKGTLFAGPNSAAAQQFQSSFPLGLGNADAKRSLMSTLGSAALDPNSASGWDRWTGPSNWGNVDDWGKTLRKSGFKEKIIYGTDPTSIYFYFNNAIYFSIRQKQHWESLGVDMTMAPNGHTLP